MNHYRSENPWLSQKFVWLEHPVPSTAEREEHPDEKFTIENLHQAGAHFTAFWKELGEHYLERDDLLEQLQLILLCQGTGLMIGSPGTAKSEIADQVLGRIHTREGKPDCFDVGFHLESRTAEVLGPLDIPRLLQEGEYERKIAEGVAPHQAAMFDEVFDAPPGVLRGCLLDVLHPDQRKRVVRTGGRKNRLPLKFGLAATNKTLDQLRQRPELADELDALIDRFGFIYWTKRDHEDATEERITEQFAQRLEKANSNGDGSGLAVAPLTYSALQVLSKAVSHVRRRGKEDGWSLQHLVKLHKTYIRGIRDRREDLGGLSPSREGSARNRNLAWNVLAASAVLRHIRNPQTPLMIVPEDFNMLRLYFMMRGPKISDIPDDLDLLPDEDRKVLGRLKIEDEVFDDAYGSVIQPRVSHHGNVTSGAAFTRMQTMVSQIEANLRAGGSNIQDLEGAAGDVEGSFDQFKIHAEQTPGGEETYAKAVKTYLALLCTMLERTGSSVKIKNDFRNVWERHAKGLKNSLYGQEIAECADAFREALKVELAREPGSFAETIERLRELSNDADLLGDKAVSAIRDVVRNACMFRIGSLEVPAQGADLQTRLEELSRFGKFMSLLRAEDRFDADSFTAKRVHMLEYLEKFLADLATKIPGMDFSKPEAKQFIDEVDLLLGELGPLLAQDFNGTYEDAHGDISGDVLSGFAADRTTSVPGRDLCEIIGVEKGHSVSLKTLAEASTAGTIKLEFASPQEENINRNADELIEAYRTFLKERIAEAAIKEETERIFSDFTTCLGETYDSKRHEGLLRREIDRAVRTALRSGQDTTFYCPLTPPKDLAPSTIIIVSDLKDTMERRSAELSISDAELQAFLKKDGIETYAQNVNVLRSIMENPSSFAGQEATFVKKSMEKTQEAINPAEFLEKIRGPLHARINTLKGKIADEMKKIDGLLSAKFTEAKKARIAAAGAPATTAGPLTFDDVVTRYAGYAREEEAGSGAPGWMNFHVTVSLDNELETSLAGDLAACLEACPTDLDVEDVGASLVQPLREAIEKLRAQNIKLENVLPGVKTAVQKKLLERLHKRREALEGNVDFANFTAQDNEEGGARLWQTRWDLVTRENEPETGLADTDKKTVEELTSILGPLTDYNQIDGVLDPPLRELQVHTCLRLIEDMLGCLQRFEMSGSGFRFADLSTLNAANVPAVDGKMRDLQFFRAPKADKPNEFDAGYLEIALELAQKVLDGKFPAEDPACAAKRDELMKRLIAAAEQAKNYEDQYFARFTAARRGR